MPWKLDGTRKHPSPGTAADHEVKLRTNFETLRETYGQSNYTFSPTEEVDVQKHERLRKRERLTLAKRTAQGVRSACRQWVLRQMPRGTYVR
jgi:hypothetical protein